MPSLPPQQKWLIPAFWDVLIKGDSQSPISSVLTLAVHAERAKSSRVKGIQPICQHENESELPLTSQSMPPPLLPSYLAHRLGELEFLSRVSTVNLQAFLLSHRPFSLLLSIYSPTGRGLNTQLWAEDHCRWPHLENIRLCCCQNSHWELIVLNLENCLKSVGPRW